MERLFLIIAFFQAIAVTSSEEVTYIVNLKGLNQVPSGIPANTTTLNLAFNQISSINPDSLTGLQISILSLTSNALTSFPDLSVIGTTLLDLNLGDNLIPSIPTDLLLGLEVIETLNLKCNRFTAFPDLSPIGATLRSLDMSENELGTIPAELLANLASLKVLFVVDTSLIAFPDLESISGTLTKVVFKDNTLQNGTISDSTMISLNSMETVEFENIGLEVFPNFSGMCDNVETLLMKNNRLTTVDPNSLQGCITLKTISFESNALTEFPDLRPAAETLESINVDHNAIAEFDDNRLQGFVMLRELRMKNNQLTEFPNITSVGQTLILVSVLNNINIAAIPADILNSLVNIQNLQLYNNMLSTLPDVPGPSNTLKNLYLGKNNFQKFPSFKFLGRSLERLHINSNPIHAISSSDLEGLDSIKVLNLDNTELTSLPDFSTIVDTLDDLELRWVPLWKVPGKHAAYLGKVKLVNLGTEATNLTIPSLCPDPGNIITLTEAPELDICDCSMVWLKLLVEDGSGSGVEVHVRDRNCTKIGKPWSEASVEELLGACQFHNVTTVGCQRHMMLSSTAPGWYCSFPPGRYLPGVNRRTCMDICFDTPGCTSYNVRAGKDRNTEDCVLVDPGAGMGGGHDVSNVTEWTYHAADQKEIICP